MSHFKLFIAFVFTLVFSFTLLVNPSAAEVIKYKFKARIVSAPWDPCDITTGTSVEGTIALNTDGMTYYPKQCYPEFCFQQAKPVTVDIRFGNEEECRIDDSMFYTAQTANSIITADWIDEQAWGKADWMRVTRSNDIFPYGSYDERWEPWTSTATTPYIALVDFMFTVIDYEKKLFNDLLLPDAWKELDEMPGMEYKAEIVFWERGSVPHRFIFQVTEFNRVTPQALIYELINTTAEINAQSGILNSLDAKLESVVEALDDVNDNNDVSAVNKLQAFINSVEAQRGNQISEDEADSLITAAQEIIDMLNVQ